MSNAASELNEKPQPISEPNGIRGWLLYICIVFTIFTPIRMMGFIHVTLAPVMLACYIGVAVTSHVAGIATWTVHSSAFVLLRIAFTVRLLYSFVQIYLGIDLVSQRVSTTLDLAKQEFLSAAVNICLVLALFLYFCVSKRIRNTFGRNI
jgi:hypothetical protein